MKKTFGIIMVCMFLAMPLFAGETTVEELTATTTTTDNDIFLINTYLTGSYTSKYITIGNLRTSLLNGAGIALGDDKPSLYNTTDSTKLGQFDLSKITTGTTRTYILQNINGTLSMTIASGSIALATSEIASESCQTITTDSVNSAAASGVLSTDIIEFTPNASIKEVTGYAPVTEDGLRITAYPTAGHVNFDVCNWSSSAITPGAVTLNWRVVR